MFSVQATEGGTILTASGEDLEELAAFVAAGPWYPDGSNFLFEESRCTVRDGADLGC